MKSMCFCFVFVIVCLSGFLIVESYGSPSPTRTYEFQCARDAIRGWIYEWNITAPLYAARGSEIILEFCSQADSDIVLIAPLFYEVTATLDNNETQQLAFSILMSEGSHNIGYSQNATQTVAIPPNAKLGSPLNVSVYSGLNRWFLFPTEIRDMNYDDLQSGYNDLTQQISILNEQVSNLAAENSNLSQQASDLNERINNLTARVNDLTDQVGDWSANYASLLTQKNSSDQQVSDLNSQVADLNSELANRTYIVIAFVVVAVLASAAALYLAIRKRTPRQPHTRNATLESPPPPDAQSASETVKEPRIVEYHENPSEQEINSSTDTPRDQVSQKEQEGSIQTENKNSTEAAEVQPESEIVSEETKVEENGNPSEQQTDSSTDNTATESSQNEREESVQTENKHHTETEVEFEEIYENVFNSNT